MTTGRPGGAPSCQTRCPLSTTWNHTAGRRVLVRFRPSAKRPRCRSLRLAPWSLAGSTGNVSARTSRVPTQALTPDFTGDPVSVSALCSFPTDPGQVGLRGPRVQIKVTVAFQVVYSEDSDPPHRFVEAVLVGWVGGFRVVATMGRPSPRA